MTKKTELKYPKIEISKIRKVPNLRNITKECPSQQKMPDMHSLRNKINHQIATPQLTNQHLAMLQEKQNLQSTLRNLNKCSAMKVYQKNQILGYLENQVNQQTVKNTQTYTPMKILKELFKVSVSKMSKLQKQV